MTGLEQQAVAALEAAQALRPVDLSGLLTTPTPAPPYVIHGLIPRRVVTLLGGHGGAGKSIVGLTLAAHVAGGEHTWAGHRIEDGRALFVSLEDPGDVVRYRLRKIAEAYGLDTAKLERRLTVLDGTGTDATLAGEINDMGVRRIAFTATLAEVEDAAQGQRLIVIDNASDAYAGNENERRQVRGFIRELGRIAHENDAGLILLAHIDKSAARNGSQGNSYSGSTAWHNSVRARLALAATDGVVELTPEKLNHGKLAEPIALAWTDAGVLMPINRATTAAGGQADDEAVVAALRAARAAGVDVGSARSGPSTAQSILATFPELPPHLHGAKGRTAFWSAVSRLMASNKVKVEEVITEQRKRRKVLVECASSEHIEYARANPPTPLCAIGAHGVRGLCTSSAPIESAQTGADSDADFAEKIMARFEREADR
jgi:KaiC/GvpD/RAD55 family RecA-like ATPase